ncbi:MAG: hypothetical protein COB16_08365 [Rhodobacteraceae bacterium]|nr:MAG: hypothetical protein COB16_08365 [Paracoccaceae bacterium]
MSTSAEQITDLIAGNAALKTFFEGERAALESARADLPGLISIVAYVDEVNGLPGSDGTLAKPYASIDAALVAARPGQQYEIRLLSNANLTARYFRNGETLRLVGWAAGGGYQLRDLTIAGASSNHPSQPAGMGLSGFVWFSNIRLIMPSGASVVGFLSSYSFLGIGFADCEIIGTVGSTPLIEGSIGTFGIGLNNTVITDMEGRWVRGFASGVALTADTCGGLIDPAITN